MTLLLKATAVLMLSTACSAAAIASDTANTDIDVFLDNPMVITQATATHSEAVVWVERRAGIESLWWSRDAGSNHRQLNTTGADDGDRFKNLRLSADGNWLLYERGPGGWPSGIAPNPAALVSPLQNTLYLRSLKASGPAVALGSDISRAAFLPDSSRLSFVKAGALHVVKLSTRKIQQQIESSTPLFRDATGRLSEYVWSPDGSQLALISARRVTAYVGVYTVGADRLRWIGADINRDSGVAWSPDGTHLAFLREPGANRYRPGQVMTGWPFEIWVAEVATGAAQRLHQSGAADGSYQGNGPLQWLDNSQVLFLSDADGYSHVYSASRVDQTVRQLTQGTCDVQFLQSRPDLGKAVLTHNCDDVHLRQVSVLTSPESSPVTISGNDELAINPAISGTQGRVVYRQTRYNHAASLVSQSGAGDEQILSRSAVNQHYSAPQQISFTAPDGLEITGTLFAPADDGVAPSGVGIVYVHGGPFRQMMPAVHPRRYYAHAYAINQYLASRGHHVLSINYRTGRGFGRDFRYVPEYGPHGAAELQDVIAAGHYLAELKTVSSAQLGIYGGSFGGYLTALALGRHPDLFAAGVAWHGIYDWTYWQKNPAPGEMGFTPWGVPLADPDVVWQSSPLAHTESWRSPVLLVSGDDDRNVLFDETVTLAQALRKDGVATETMVLPNEIHGFLRYNSWLRVAQRTAAFLERHLINEDTEED